jgi:phage terminase large subunit
MPTLRIPMAPVFRPLLEPTRYKGAFGGRGSGKSHFFGELMVERCLVNPGTLAVGIREVQKSLLQSSKRLIESKIQSLGVGAHFQVLHDRIVTPGDGLIIFQGMQDSSLFCTFCVQSNTNRSLRAFKPAWSTRHLCLTSSNTLIAPIAIPCTGGHPMKHFLTTHMRRPTARLATRSGLVNESSHEPSARRKIAPK